jgi:uncharacterized radical SAM protein YgiQ
MTMAFLPISKKDMIEQGLETVDFVLISGDAYVDHPSFGTAIIGRVLQAHGFTVAICAQPDWHNDEILKQYGMPNLAYMVTAGNIDSMVNHYTVNRKKRDKDYYTDNGVMGKRPDRATIVYSQWIRKIHPKAPIIIGGIEASLRRMSHYDYWDDKVRSSILMDSTADLLVYGMAENIVVEIAEALKANLPIEELTYIRGTVWKTKTKENPDKAIILPTFAEVKEDKKKYTESFLLQYRNTDAFTGLPLVETYGNVRIIQNKPAFALTQSEMDWVYALPFERKFHPSYTNIPAIEEVQFSLISNRGCFGSCNFCAITQHQGRMITSRSTPSLVEEATKITQMPNFKGYIHDVGGPTANFHQPSCQKQLTLGTCKYKDCLHPKPCAQLEVSHEKYLDALRQIRAIPKIKKVFIRSGIRYDYLVFDQDETFFDELIQYHISGQLKVAPEHVSPRVLDKMGKPSFELYDKFVKKYEAKNKQFNKDQYLVPYLISSHPGSDLKDAVELALYLKKIGHQPQQVQDFYPTPFTASTCMYYTEMDPFTGEKIYVAKTVKDKTLQRVLMQYANPKNAHLVFEALKQANRLDLVGFGKHCLIRPLPQRRTHDHSK